MRRALADALAVARSAHRRGGVGPNRRGNYRGAGGGTRDTGHSLAGGGTFTRSTEAVRWLGAATDGSTAFLEWVLANVRVLEDRGDGLGTMLRIEGSRTNLLPRSEEVDLWTNTGATITQIPNVTPDGAGNVQRLQTPSGQIGPRQGGATSISARNCSSIFERASSGTQSYQIVQGSSGASAQGGSIGTTWARKELNRSADSTTEFLFAADGRDWTGFSGIVAGARDIYAWGAQLEPGRFPTSYIRTAAAAVTRGQDVLTYAVGQYPASFLSAGFRLRIAFDFASTEIVAGEIFSIICTTPFGNGEIALVHSGGLVRFRVTRGDGSGNEETGAVSFSRRQLITLELRPGVSLVTSGLTSGNGTTALTGGAWASGTLCIGLRSDGTSPFFGSYNPTIEAL